MITTTSTIDIQLNTVQDGLGDLATQLNGSNHEELNAVLALLYNNFNQARGATVLDDEIVLSTELTTSDLLQTLMVEIGKTRQQLALFEASNVKIRGASIQAKNKELASKLAETWTKIEASEKETKKAEIAKWCLFAIGLLVLIGSCFVTGGAAIPGAILGGAFMLMSVIPCETKDGRQVTISDKWTQAISDSIYKGVVVSSARDSLKALGKEGVDAMTDDDVVDYCHENNVVNTSRAKNVSASFDSSAKEQAKCSYGSMTVVILTELIATIIVASISAAVFKDPSNTTSSAAGGVAGAGASGASAGASIASSEAAALTTQASSTALETAVKALRAILTRLTQMLLKLQKIFNAAQAATNIGIAAAQIAKSGVTRQASEAQADVDELKATISYLERLLANEQQLLKELMATWLDHSTMVQALLTTEHRTGQRAIAAMV